MPKVTILISDDPYLTTVRGADSYPLEALSAEDELAATVAMLGRLDGPDLLWLHNHVIAPRLREYAESVRAAGTGGADAADAPAG